mmetsp:Transcript_8865/g.17321  ORF Transcript_8865/g.17321 Transcript_8865/m.17321 type:complete len:100 (-) Transcript_8865:1345-1644(-)
MLLASPSVCSPACLQDFRSAVFRFHAADTTALLCIANLASGKVLKREEKEKERPGHSLLHSASISLYSVVKAKRMASERDCQGSVTFRFPIQKGPGLLR